METTHTPGPWELDGPSTAHVTDEDYHNIRAGCGFWAEAKDQRESGFSISGHMSIADARLIVAAPELLEALAAVVNYFWDPDREPGGLGEGDINELAHAAIAKATGSAA
jgi:hypothetical protein